MNASRTRTGADQSSAVDPRVDLRVDPRIERNRQLVLEAAAELLATEGIDRLTIDAVAQRSGVARSTIYRHWPERAELLAAAFESIATFTEADEDAPITTLIRTKAVDLARDLSEREMGRALPSIVAAAARDDAVRQALLRFRQARVDAWCAAIDRATARGELPATTPVDHRVAIERFIASFLMRHLVSFEPLDDAFRRQQIDLLHVDLGL